MNTKAFLVLFVFLLLFIGLIGALLSGSDLTPGASPSSGSVLRNSNLPNQAAIGNGANQSPCSSEYTIQQGDTLSSIATRCSLTLNDLLAVNSTIGDPNVIRPGEKITIPALAEAQTVAPPQAALVTPTPLVSSGNEQQPVVEPLAIILSTQTTEPGSNASLPQKISVEIHGLPANTKVQIQVGPLNGPYTLLDEKMTDAKGQLKTEVTLPLDVKPGEELTIAVVTESEPAIVITSVPFKTGGAP